MTSLASFLATREGTEPHDDLAGAVLVPDTLGEQAQRHACEEHRPDAGLLHCCTEARHCVSFCCFFRSFLMRSAGLLPAYFWAMRLSHGFLVIHSYSLAAWSSSRAENSISTSTRPARMSASSRTSRLLVVRMVMSPCGVQIPSSALSSAAMVVPSSSLRCVAA